MGILGLFETFEKATKEQSRESADHLRQALARWLDNAQDYTTLFAYGVRTGFLSTLHVCYAVGFSCKINSLAIVPIYYDSDETEELIVLNKEEIQCIRTGGQGEKIIKANGLQGGELCLTLPAYTKRNAREERLLPIDQRKAVAEFERWIRENFNSNDGAPSPA